MLVMVQVLAVRERFADVGNRTHCVYEGAARLNVTLNWFVFGKEQNICGGTCESTFFTIRSY